MEEEQAKARMEALKDSERNFLFEYVTQHEAIDGLSKEEKAAFSKNIVFIFSFFFDYGFRTKATNSSTTVSETSGELSFLSSSSSG
mmetsp:Transcript_24556/g.38096  ORF Transcript_24556/g.38096 Transcript_24556/m.38096 type:complete len:86 (+) Transcript_24556:266-523(+)